MNSLIDSLKKWDGVHMDYLRQIYSSFNTEPEFLNDLIAFLSQKDLQIQASWLIKHHYDQKNKLDPNQVDSLMKQTTELDQWEAQLHILQIIPKIHSEPQHLLLMDDFARRSLKSENKFVRAWSYQGLFELYKLGVVQEEELRSLCELAMETESAAIQSKVRKILIVLNK